MVFPEEDDQAALADYAAAFAEAVAGDSPLPWSAVSDASGNPRGILLASASGQRL